MPPREWPGWGNALNTHLADIRAADRWRHPRTFDTLGPAGTLDAPPTPETDDAAPSPGAVVSSPRTTTSGSPPTRRWMARRSHEARPVGCGFRSARLIVGSRPVHPELEHEARGVEAAPSRAIALPHRLRPNLGSSPCCVRRGPAACSLCQRRAEPRVDHRRVPTHARRADRDLRSPRPRPPGEAAPVKNTRADRGWSSPTPSSRWTATSPTSTRFARSFSREVGCSWSTRLTPFSGRQARHRRS